MDKEKKVYGTQGAPVEVLERIAGAKRILISGHVRPDGDSLGSMIALAHALSALGKKAAGVVESRKTLGGPGFLRGVDDLLEPADLAGRRFDLLLAVDCATFDRLPECVRGAAAGIPLWINIDHHCTNDFFAGINWVRPRASSAGELVWRLIRKAGWPFDDIAAEALWVAVATDTGRFAYDTTSASTLRCGADLVARGVRTAFINDRLYCSFSRVAVELKRRAYQTLAVEGDLAWVQLTGRDFAEVGGTKADAEDVVEIPRSLVGNKVALFFYGPEDNAPGETRISIRTRAPFDATELAGKFGGGGHLRAAGCTVYESLSKAKRLFLKACGEWMRAAVRNPS